MLSKYNRTGVVYYCTNYYAEIVYNVYIFGRFKIEQVTIMVYGFVDFWVSYLF
jgi:hypothetical protein